MPHTGAQDQSRSEHFLQNGGCTVEAQDSGLLDGVVVLIEGEGAGDAIDGAACDGVDDGLLVVVIASSQTGILSSRSLLDAIERCDLAAFEPLVEKHLYGGIRRLGSKLTEEYADYFEPEK